MESLRNHAGRYPGFSGNAKGNGANTPS